MCHRVKYCHRCGHSSFGPVVRCRNARRDPITRRWRSCGVISHTVTSQAGSLCGKDGCILSQQGGVWICCRCTFWIHGRRSQPLLLMRKCGLWARDMWPLFAMDAWKCSGYDWGWKRRCEFKLGTVKSIRTGILGFWEKRFRCCGRRLRKERKSPGVSSINVCLIFYTTECGEDLKRRWTDFVATKCILSTMFEWQEHWRLHHSAC